jgi:transcriptional regulator with XRE-family HTH domain
MRQDWIVRTGPDLGRAIAEIRRSRQLTQEQLAPAVGLSRHWLAKLERGRSAVVLDQIIRVLRRLDATITITFDAPDLDQLDLPGPPNTSASPAPLDPDQPNG